MQNLLVWNFSAERVAAEISLVGLAKNVRVRHIVLDAVTASDDENARLKPDPFIRMEKGDRKLPLPLEPYAIHYWSFE